MSHLKKSDIFRAYPFSTSAKFSETLTFLPHLLLKRLRTCAYQGVRNVSFSENFARYVMNDPFLVFYLSTAKTSKIVVKLKIAGFYYDIWIVIKFRKF